MNIEPISGEHWRFMVSSEGRDDSTHVVDLTSNDGVGECSCEDWTFRKFPHWRKTGEVTECKHITAVMLWEMRRQMSESVEHARPKAMTVKASQDGLPF